MNELLLELYSEEIPALMQEPATKAYILIFQKILTDNEISFIEINSYAGPRRITMHIKGLPLIVPEKTVDIKGPRISANLQAIEGFCKSHNIDTVNQLANDGTFYIYKKTIPASPLDKILLELVPKAIGDYSWPKSMFWGEYKIKWVRPLKNILCLLDGNILPIQYGHLKANNHSFGHRFISHEQLTVKSFEDYKTQLEKHYVILDHNERKRQIIQQINEIESELNVKIVEDPKLLDEVAGLVEYPTVAFGNISRDFLPPNLPREVLTTSMKNHQRYFSVADQDGNLAPYFLFVSNAKINDNIIKGNEKVLSARLRDALFFYNQDKLESQEDIEKKLKSMLFYPKLGSMYNKLERLQGIAEQNKIQKIRDSLLKTMPKCKNDLVSSMVSEFPELQGVMGYYYAKTNGYDEEIAIAISDHYKPQGESDGLPKTILAKHLALIDKIDSLVGLMSAGVRATSSSDRFGLRRLALGIIRILLDDDTQLFGEICLDITAIIDCAQKQYTKVNKIAVSTELKQEIVKFIEDRVKYYFYKTYDKNHVNVVVDSRGLKNIEQIKPCLDYFLNDTKEFSLIGTYRRIYGYKTEFDKLDIKSCEINLSLFTDNEKLLYDEFVKASGEFEEKGEDKLSNVNRWMDATICQVLSELCESLHAVLEKYVIEKENDGYTYTPATNNRLALLYQIQCLFLKVFNFDALL